MNNGWDLHSCSRCGAEIEFDDGHNTTSGLVCGDCAVELADLEELKTKVVKKYLNGDYK